MNEVAVVDTHFDLLAGRLGMKVRAIFEARLAAPVYAHKPGVATWLNEETATLARTPGDLRLVAGATVHLATSAVLTSFDTLSRASVLAC